MTEWRPITGFPDYEVSDDGQVRSWRPPRASKRRRIVPLLLAQTLQPKNGYLMVTLCNGGPKRPYGIHRLMAEAFLPNPQHLPFVCHNNGNGGDNRLENLRWDTAQGNANDKPRHGTAYQSERVKWALFTEAEVRAIRKRCQVGPRGTRKRIAEERGVSYATIKHMVSGRNWRSVT